MVTHQFNSTNRVVTKRIAINLGKIAIHGNSVSTQLPFLVNFSIIYVFSFQATPENPSRDLRCFFNIFVVRIDHPPKVGETSQLGDY